MKKTSRIERLAQKEEKLIVKRIVFLSAVSCIIIVLLFTLGIPILGRFTDLLSFLFQKNQSSGASVQTTSILPPGLNPLPKFTNNNSLSISGYSDGTKVVVQLNGSEAGEAKVQDGKFTYDGLALKNGENQIAAKSVSDNGKESDLSQTQVVNLDTTAPNLQLDGPQDSQSFSGDNKIKVWGKTDKDAQVYANGFLATVGADGTFEVFVPLLSDGENTIEVKALDDAGNTTIQKIKVNYKK